MLLRSVLLVCVLAGMPAFAETINVADHGVRPGNDATLPMFRLLDEIRGRSGVTLAFAAGTYTFYPENAFETYRTIANHDNGLKRIIFPVFDLDGLTIDGGGAEFVFHGRVVPFVIDASRQITLKNFSIDWRRPFQSEMAVVESSPDAQGFVVEIDAQEFPFVLREGALHFEHYGWEDPLGVQAVLDGQTRLGVQDMADYTLPLEGVRAEALEGNRVRIAGPGIVPPPVGSVIVSAGAYPSNRGCPAIHVANGQDIRVENVKVHNAGGMGFIAERTNGIRLEGFQVTPRPGGKRLVSTCSDAVHFVGCQGDVVVEHCEFAHMLGDGANAHGVYAKVVEFIGGLRFLCELSHPQQWGITFAEPGDWVSLIWRETVLSLYETTIVNIDRLNEQRFVLTLNKLPDVLPTGPLAFENVTWYPVFTLRDSKVHAPLGRGLVSNTKGKAEIGNNRISAGMQAILLEGDNNFRYESGGVQDVLIEGNEIESVGPDAGYTLRISPLLTPEQRHGQIRYHQNIRFLDNEVRTLDGKLVYASSVSELRIAENTFILNNGRGASEGAPAIDLRYCRNVLLENNGLQGFDPEPIIAISEDSEGIELSYQRGFKVKR